jgi:hypothetical protein
MGYPRTNRPNDWLGPATHGVAVDISSTDHTFDHPTRAIYVGGGGTLNVKLHGDPATTLTLVVVDGAFLPLRIQTVVRASTDASLMVALF